MLFLLFNIFFVHCNWLKDLILLYLVDTYIPKNSIRSSLFYLGSTKKRKYPEGMTFPPSVEQVQSTTRLPRFKGLFYGWWKKHVHNDINVKKLSCGILFLMKLTFAPKMWQLESLVRWFPNFEGNRIKCVGGR